MSSQNIDPIEIEKFSRSAAHWWDLQGEFKTLHDLNPVRLNFIEKNISLAEKNVIDVGCGGGILTESLAKKGAIVTGIDMSLPALEVARLHQFESNTKIDYVHTTAENIAAERPSSYDIVTCFEMLEHVPDPVSIVNACAALAKPNGYLFFSTLNRNLKSYLFAIVGAEYVLKLLPQNTHDFSKFIRPSELGAWCRKAGLDIKSMAGMNYNVFNKTFSLSEDLSVNYLVCLQKK